jgi:hypothetical protein
VFPLLIKIKDVEIKKPTLKLDRLSIIFLIYLILSVLIKVIVFLRVGTTLGADVGRFATISHIFLLKKNIVTNLQPYDMPTGYFYFPGSVVLMTIGELIGINSIDFITISTFLFSTMSTLIFYLLTSKILTRKKAITAFFFYSFVLDVVLNYAIFGNFSYAFSTTFFLMLCLISFELFFEKKERFLILTLSIFGLLSFHFYLIFPIVVLLLSLFTYEFVNEKQPFRKSRNIICNYFKALVISLILLLPFFYLFGSYFFLAFNKDNMIDTLMVSYERERFSFDEKIWNLFFISPSIIPSSIFIIAFVVFLIQINRLIKTKSAVFVYFFSYLSIQSYMLFTNANFQRVVTNLWIIYAFGFSSFFTNPILNIAILPVFYFVPSPSTIYFLNILTPVEKTEPEILPWVVWSEYYDAMNFIKKNTSENSVFLVDGGGSGCFGASASYGERIFPLTSRKVFYFTDYCWANYDKSDYRHRVDIYRRISINPNDSEALENLKEYGVTHVFIGPSDVGLKFELFSGSKNYELVYNEKNFKIFEIK